MASLADLLFASSVAPDAPLVHWQGRTWSRGDIAAAADRVADTLRRMAVAPDSAVAALVPSTPLGVVALFGIWRAGAVASPLAPSHPIAVGAADAPDGPDFPDPLVDPAFDRLVAEIRPAATVRASLDAASLVPQVSVAAGTPRHYDPAVALIVTDRGSDGSAAAHPPRRRLLGHAAVGAAVAAADGTLRGSPGARIVTVPLGSWSGVDSLLVAAAAGDPVALVHPVAAAALVEAARTHGVETVALTAETVATLTADPATVSLEPLRWVRVVGRPPTPDDAREFRRRFGVTVLGTYGRPELGGEVAGWTPGDVRAHGDVKLGSVGRPYAGVDIRIERDDRTDAAPDEPGWVWIRSPFAALGDASERIVPAPRTDPEGFVRTGDRGRVDRDGFLWIDAAPPAAWGLGA